MSKIETYQNLIEEFQKIPHTEIKDETFISICGYPHYERVSSNILAFFFDTTREHNLKDLFVKSLLEAAGLDPKDYPSEFIAETEYLTKKNNYIDILLNSDEINIIIENKIWANINNDLDDYYDTGCEDGKRKPLGFILTLQPSTKRFSNFVNITHEQLYECVLRNLEIYKKNSNEKYFPFLKDYIENMDNIKMKLSIREEFISLIRNNEKEIIDFSQQLETFKTHIQTLAENVEKILKKEYHYKNYKIESCIDHLGIGHWVYIENFIDSETTITLEAHISADGWRFNIWFRKSRCRRNDKTFLSKYIVDIDNGHFDKKEVEKRVNKVDCYVLNQGVYNLSTDVNEIAKYMKTQFDVIISNIKSTKH